MLDKRQPISDRFVDLTGLQYGDRTVKSFAGFHGKFPKWHVECKCGKQLTIFANAIRQAASGKRSGAICTCRRGFAQQNKYLYYTWSKIRTSGIEVDPEWRASFYAFADYMGPRPKGQRLHRIDQSKGYVPGNCRWATRQEINAELGRCKTITYNGKTQGLDTWAKEIGISRQMLEIRLAKYTPEFALSYGRLKQGELPPGVSHHRKGGRKKSVNIPAAGEPAAGRS